MHSTLLTLSSLLILATASAVPESFSTSSRLPQPTVSAPPPLATNEIRIETCNTGQLSNQRFSRDAAVGLISTVCNDLISKAVVFGPNDNHFFPSGAPFDHDARQQGAQVANASAVLYVHVAFEDYACPGGVDASGHTTEITTDFSKVSMADCQAPFLVALDGCGDFTNANGLFWKWGGSVSKNCLAYNVDANVDTKLAPGPGY